MNTYYAIAKLIEAMGMLVHDLWELKCGEDRVYEEDSYNKLSQDILRTCFERRTL